MQPEIETFVRLAGGHRTKGTRIKLNALRQGFHRHQEKQAIESWVFVRFAETIRLMSDPFDHENQDPPWPDIRASIDGSSYLFELGEVTDEYLAKTLSDSAKRAGIAGCATSAVGPLMHMLKQKCGKKYQTGGAPVDLLLYYWRHDPFESVSDYLDLNYPTLSVLFTGSPFKRVWVYSFDTQELLWMTEVRH